MIFNHRVVLFDNYVALTDEVTGLEVAILYKDIEKVRGKLLDAKKMQKSFESTNLSLAELETFLTGEAKEFVKTLLEMGLVIPIQKQATIVKSDGR